MRIPESIRLRLERWAKHKIATTPPDFIIRPKGVDQTLRWFVIPKNPLFNIYLHKFVESDEDRALHDHPWVNCSILISGEYQEHIRHEAKGRLLIVNTLLRIPTVWIESLRRRQGFCYFRRPSTAHRVELITEIKVDHISWNGLNDFSVGGLRISKPVITLFITGPRVRNWGFWCPKGWRRWQDFCDVRDKGFIGRGCE